MKISNAKSFLTKKRLFIAVLAIFIAISLYYGIKPAPYRPHGIVAIHEISDLPRFIAHNATVGKALPNSRHALKQSLLTSVGGIELDVRMTKDNIPVIFHSLDLSELTNGNGSVENKTYEEISSLTYKSNDSGHEKILSLEEALKLIDSKKYIFLDIKDDHIFNQTFAQSLSNVITKLHLENTVIIESLNPIFLYQIRKLNPNILIMYDFATKTQATAEESPEQLNNIPWFMKSIWFLNWVNWSIKPDILGPRYSVALQELRSLARRGYPLIARTVDDKDLALKLFNNGVHGVQSNLAESLMHELNIIPNNEFSDAGRIDKNQVTLIKVFNEKDIKNILTLANKTNKKISIAGRRHTQGGHTFAKDNIVIDMKGFNRIELLPDNHTLRVESGATWEDIQKYLDQRQLSVKIMQSDNIFTVGGTISVNAHGWQVGMPPISSTVKSFRLMLANGNVLYCDRIKNKELFSAVLGGYGLFGIILDIDLETEYNYQYQSSQWVVKTQDFPDLFKKHVTNNTKADLAYGRLNISKKNLFDEAILKVYTRFDDNRISKDSLEPEKYVSLKQKIFRNSERNESSKAFRWRLEKSLGSKIEASSISRNNVMSPDIHVLWPLDMDKYDILQEYFVPQTAFMQFISALKNSILNHDMNLLNVTIREVRKDKDTLLNYASADVFSFVLYFSQEKGNQAEARMKDFTTTMVDQVLNMGGTFYLPYRPHYTRAQFEQAYPNIDQFIQIKEQVDPNERFTNNFYLNYIKTEIE